MDTSDALAFIYSLAYGFDPVTGDVLAEDSPLHHPQVIRALFAAARLMESQCDKSVSNGDDPHPARAGEPWDEREDQELTHAFHAGDSFSKIAQSHQRSRGAIVSRLDHLGCIHMKSATAIDGPLLIQNAEHPDEKRWRKERPQAGKPWTDQEDAELREYAVSCITTEEIARRLGRGTSGVEVRLCKLGLRHNTRPAPTDDIPF
jgi:hypothetical protein